MSHTGAVVCLILFHSSFGLFRIPLIKEHIDHLSRTSWSGKRWDFITNGEDNALDQTAHPLQLINFLNLQYSGRIRLGTPPQEFRVLVDTGSADFWVFSSKCSIFNRSCRQHRQYDSSLSTTYKENGNEVSLGYLKGSINGFTSTDVLLIAGLEVVNQTFIEVIGESEGTYSNTDFDGIIGLGFQALSRSKVNTPLTNMVTQNLIKPIFSVLLNRIDEGMSGGELLLGGWDSSKFQPETLNTMPVTKPIYWQIAMDGVAIDGGELVYCSTKCEAVFDTGSSLIMGPADQVKQIFSDLPANIFIEDGLALVACEDVDFLPDIVFYIHGQEYKLSSYDYILRDESGFIEMCVIGIGGLTEKQIDLWILGDIFLRKFYTIFDLGNKTISLAHKVSNV